MTVKWLTVWVVFLLVFAVVACGDDDDDSSSDNVSQDDDNDADDDDISDDDQVDDDANDDDQIDDDVSDDDAADDDSDDDVVDDDMTDDDTIDDDTTEYVTPHLKDDLGREIIVHGVNYMGLEYGGFDHTQEDYDRIAAWGFTHVRLPISWKFMEPEEGVWDESYVNDILIPELEMAENAGLQVIVDMHQWQWCSAFNGNGCPDWTCEGLYPEGLIGMVQFSQDFWAGDLPQHWTQAWEFVWERVAGHPAVFGYDLFNEPWAGIYGLLAGFDQEVLQPFYENLISILREYDETAWVGIEPQMTRDFWPVFLQPIDDPRVMYMPHNYTCFTGFGGVDYWCGPDWMARDKKILADQREMLNMPTIVGEWGITSCVEGVREYMQDAVTGHDQRALNETVWVYHRDDCSWGLLDAAGNEKADYLDFLIRPYPRAVAGHIESYGFDFDTRVFSFNYVETDVEGDTLLFVPARQYPDGFTFSTTDPEGTYAWDYDESTQVLTYTADPGSESHTLTIETLN